jgi:hypothetical protein
VLRDPPRPCASFPSLAARPWTSPGHSSLAVRSLGSGDGSSARHGPMLIRRWTLVVGGRCFGCTGESLGCERSCRLRATDRWCHFFFLFFSASSSSHLHHGLPSQEPNGTSFRGRIPPSLLPSTQLGPPSCLGWVAALCCAVLAMPLVGEIYRLPSNQSGGFSRVAGGRTWTIFPYRYHARV